MKKTEIEDLLKKHKGKKTAFITELEQIIDAEVEVEVTDALENYEIEETEAEKIGVNYTVKEFKDCQSFDDFKEKYLEVQRRSFNFM